MSLLKNLSAKLHARKLEKAKMDQYRLKQRKSMELIEQKKAFARKLKIIRDQERKRVFKKNRSFGEKLGGLRKGLKKLNACVNKSSINKVKFSTGNKGRVRKVVYYNSPVRVKSQAELKAERRRKAINDFNNLF